MLVWYRLDIPEWRSRGSGWVGPVWLRAKCAIACTGRRWFWRFQLLAGWETMAILESRGSRLLTGTEMDRITAGSAGSINEAEAHALSSVSHATASASALPGQLGDRPIGRCCERRRMFSRYIGRAIQVGMYISSGVLHAYRGCLTDRTASTGPSFPMLVRDVCCLDRHRTQHCCSSASVRTSFQQPASSPRCTFEIPVFYIIRRGFDDARKRKLRICL